MLRIFGLLLEIVVGAFWLPSIADSEEFEIIRTHTIEPFEEDIDLAAVPIANIHFHILSETKVAGQTDQFPGMKIFWAKGHSGREDGGFVWQLRWEPVTEPLAPEVEFQVHTDDRMRIQSIEISDVTAPFVNASQITEQQKDEMEVQLKRSIGWIFIPLPQGAVGMNDVLIEKERVMEILLMGPPAEAEIVENTLESRVAGISRIDGQTLLAAQHSGELVYKSGAQTIEIAIDGFSYIDVELGVVVEFKISQSMQPLSEPDNAFVKINTFGRLPN